jgi:hypothetical protein
MPDHIFYSVLKSCPDGSVCLIKAKEAYTQTVTKVLKMSRRESACHTLAAYGTQLDDIIPNDWERSRKEVTTKVFPHDRENIRRTRLTAAGYYMGNRSLIHLSGAFPAYDPTLSDDTDPDKLDDVDYPSTNQDDWEEEDEDLEDEEEDDSIQMENHVSDHIQAPPGFFLHKNFYWPEKKAPIGALWQADTQIKVSISCYAFYNNLLMGFN